MDLLDVNAKVHLHGVDDAVETATALAEKINEAKVLANELAMLVEKLEVKVEM